MAKKKASFIKRLVPVNGELFEIPVNIGEMVDGKWQDKGTQQQNHALVDGEFRKVVNGQVFKITTDDNGSEVRTLQPNMHVAEVFDPIQ